MRFIELLRVTLRRRRRASSYSVQALRQPGRVGPAVQVLFWRAASMSKKSKTRSRSKTPSETHALRPGPNWPLLAVSSLGIALTGYLSWTAFSGAAVQGCSAGGGCDAVLTSRWATLLGLPTALWGLLAYAGLAAIAFVRRADKHWSYAWTAAFFGVCYSVYLTVVSLTILESACPYCLTSLGTHDRHARARGVATSFRDGAPLLGGSGRRPGRARGPGDPAPPRQLRRSAGRAHSGRKTR